MKKSKLKRKYLDLRYRYKIVCGQSSIWKRKYDEMILLNSKQDTEINILQVDNDNLRDAMKERDKKISEQKRDIEDYCQNIQDKIKLSFTKAKEMEVLREENELLKLR